MTPVNKNTEVDENLVKEKEAAFAEFIQRKGLKTTRQRNTIVSTFFRLRGHISVEELLNEVKKANPRIGYATVYRTLHLLVESNLVEERRFGDGLARYEGHSRRRAPRPHDLPRMRRDLRVLQSPAGGSAGAAGRGEQLQDLSSPAGALRCLQGH